MYQVTAFILPGKKTPATTFPEHAGPENLMLGKIAAFSLGIYTYIYR